MRTRSQTAKLANAARQEEVCPIMSEEMQELETKIANVMQTSTVVKTIFSYLSLENIKNCRFVCQNWKGIAEPLLRKRSKIVLDIYSSRTPSSYSETFDFPSLTINFTAFSFSRGYWPKAVVENFLREQRGNIQELEFNNITLTDEREEEIENPCISDMIADLNLRKLSVLCSQPGQPIFRHWECNLVVTLNVLTSIQELILDSCKITVKPGDPIMPKIIKLNFVAIHNEGESIMEEFCINQLVSFKRATYIELKCPIISSTCRGTKLKLNLEECTELTDLKLTQAVVLEKWAMGKCNLNILYLDGVPFFGNRHMKVKKLSHQCSTIDLSTISSEVEEIYLYSYANAVTTINWSQPSVFHKLKSLHLFGEAAYVLPYFKETQNNYNLADLYIGGHHDYVLKLRWVPRTVKRLHVGITKNIVKDGLQKLEIDTLVLDSYSFHEATTVLEKINPQNLVLERKIDPDEYNDHIMSFVNKFTSIKIYVGPFPDDAKNRHSWARFSEFVDKMSSFYVFENQRGQAISKTDFENHKIPTL